MQEQRDTKQNTGSKIKRKSVLFKNSENAKKVKFNLEQDMKPQRGGGEIYYSTLSLTSALVGGGWST